ncbi:hypothetical protein M427DRAFT_32394 [Gonapodya prolifera JEL478]|uniref:Uncharacterized protein n=1 Tax=Gonapodya prolifera (strain JEL478) TaxID=1344416 RepID=A0A139AFV2_GONPJ|nr:hypothetical protein M427DRAFT_32394 [Gonapodya prolifera JEL478]|eukprot:KXS15444.1 hypothetical protein M427DRAFT_32394 [Gonapodya prolifera JEL478]
MSLPSSPTHESPNTLITNEYAALKTFTGLIAQSEHPLPPLLGVKSVTSYPSPTIVEASQRLRSNVLALHVKTGAVPCRARPVHVPDGVEELNAKVLVFEQVGFLLDSGAVLRGGGGNIGSDCGRGRRVSKPRTGARYFVGRSDVVPISN